MKGLKQQRKERTNTATQLLRHVQENGKHKPITEEWSEGEGGWGQYL